MSVLSIRFRYYMSAHDGPSSYSKSRVFGNFPATGGRNTGNSPEGQFSQKSPAFVLPYMFSLPCLLRFQLGAGRLCLFSLFGVQRIAGRSADQQAD